MPHTFSVCGIYYAYSSPFLKFGNEVFTWL